MILFKDVSDGLSFKVLVEYKAVLYLLGQLVYEKFSIARQIGRRKYWVQGNSNNKMVSNIEKLT